MIGLLLMPRAAAAQGDPLGPEFRVNTYTTSYQFSRSVALSSLGDFVVVWNSYTQDGSSWGVFGQRYATSGTPLGAEFRVNTYTSFSQVGASVATDSAGNFVVVWSSGGQYPFDTDLFGQRYASSGTPLGPEFRVNTYVLPSNQYNPSVAASAAGDFVVVWNSGGQDGSLGAVFGQRYAAAGSPLGPEFRVNTFTTGHQGSPAVACDTAGNFVVTWPSYLQDGSLGGVFGQRYASSGTPLGPEFRVNAYTTGTQHLPAVALDSSGNFVVVWQGDAQDGSARGIFGQRFTNTGTPLGGEFRVNTYTTSEQSSPRVAADAAGAFVVVWASDDQKGSTYGIFGQRYDPVGTALGPEFRVNTYTSFYQRFPAVSADSSGRFVVVWTSEMQDGSYTGVYGQRYSQMVPVELMQFAVE